MFCFFTGDDCVPIGDPSFYTSFLLIPALNHPFVRVDFADFEGVIKGIVTYSIQRISYSKELLYSLKRFKWNPPLLHPQTSFVEGITTKRILNIPPSARGAASAPPSALGKTGGEGTHRGIAREMGCRNGALARHEWNPFFFFGGGKIYLVDLFPNPVR